MAILEVLAQIVYVTCAVVSVRLWFRSRSQQAAWSAATFMALGGVVAFVWVVGDDEPLTGLLLDIVVIAILLVPWLLFRFADSVVHATSWMRISLDVIGLAAAFSVLLIPDLPGPEEVPTTAQNAWTAMVIVAWVLQSAMAAWLLWHAGKGQPGVTRGRVRLLAVGGLLLALSVVSSGSTGDSGAGQVVGQLLSVTSSLTFLLGFAPPPLLRSAWRAVDERELHVAAAGLLSATDDHDIRRTLVPSVRALLGAPGLIAFAPSIEDWISDGEAVDLNDPRTTNLDVGPMKVAYSHSPSMPLFGPGEKELVDRLSLLASLAAERVRFVAAERRAREQAEQATEALALANLELADLNDELEAFVYTASHDLRNPVIAILGYLEVLREDTALTLPDDARHYLERMQVNAEFMRSLIADLLELSRVGRVDTESQEVALSPMVASVAEEAARRHSDLTLDVRQETANVSLWANHGRVRQLFENLIENACRYAGRTDVAVNVSAVTQEDGSSIIEVRDNGQGIPEDQLDRVFGMFERLDPNVSTGTGMGLAICRRIVESSGGRIVALPCDDGAHMRLQWPARQDNDAASLAAEAKG